MLIEILFTLILVVIITNIVFKTNKLPFVISYYRNARIQSIIATILSCQKNKSKIEFYFPQDSYLKPTDRIIILEWFITQSNVNLTIHTSENIYQTLNINKKYKEFEQDFYNHFGFIPTLDESNVIEDIEINLEWENENENNSYQNKIEWSILAIYAWLIQTGIIDYFDDNYKKIENDFQKSQSFIELIEEETIEETIEDNSIQSTCNKDIPESITKKEKKKGIKEVII